MKTITSSPDTHAPAQLRRRTNRFGFWIRRVLVALLLALVALATIGAIYRTTSAPILRPANWWMLAATSYT